MNFHQFRQKIQKILEVELPSGVSVSSEGREIASDIKLGRTAFMDKTGVTSELEYKIQCIKNKQLMFHAHIGMNTWQDTAEALAILYKTAATSGFVVDRAGICLDRRMGLPKNQRGQMPAETGPMLETRQDWLQIGRVVPIQPHMGDFMIGFPAIMLRLPLKRSKPFPSWVPCVKRVPWCIHTWKTVLVPYSMIVPPLPAGRCWNVISWKIFWGPDFPIVLAD
jgi:hypothetical protein